MDTNYLNSIAEGSPEEAEAKLLEQDDYDELEG